MAKIHVISGPPCSGKSTFVQENADAGDVVVDMDVLAQALGEPSTHGATGDIWALAREARAVVVGMILDGIDTAAWIIHTDPSQTWRANYVEAGASIIELNPGKDECLARALAEGRPQQSVDGIEEWYARRG